jgi:peptidoglycan/LPS O-acetylase OafA/YrhL
MRIRQLDILRALAVLLVIGRHMPLPEGEAAGAWPAPLLTLLGWWHKIGWVGVDLFFVLSGYLVSGLLFREYAECGTCNVKRFLVRRGFKIYPAFYTFLAATLVLRLFTGKTATTTQLAGEVFFLQNYLGAAWNHTWSLAVEEHFYLLLAGLFVLLLLLAPRNPFGLMEPLVAGVALVCLGLRIATAVARQPFELMVHVFPTHLRLDSLAFGVLLAYWEYCKPQRLRPFRARPLLTLALAAVLIWPAFQFELYHAFMDTVGFTLLYLAFGGVLVVATGLTLPRRGPLDPLGRGLAFFGRHSYSVYLWHMPVLGVVLALSAALHFADQDYLILLLYLALCPLCGIVMARCVEFPVLWLRDRLFAANGPEPVVVAVTAMPARTEPSRVPTV